MAKKDEKTEEKKEVLLKSEKEKLLELHQTLKDLGVNSLSDLEVKISRL